METEILKKVLDSLDSLCVVYDLNGNIVYPVGDFKRIMLVDNILKSKDKCDDIIYCDDRWYKLKIEPLLIGKNNYKIVILQDITYYKCDEIKNQIDVTTKIFNKKAFFEKLNLYLNFVSGKDINFSIFIGDIDYFKNVNDSYGHLNGDYILGQIGQIIKENCNYCDFANGFGLDSMEKDVLGRFGGEEFVGLLKNINLEESFYKIENIRREIEMCKYLFDDNVSNVTMSFGLYGTNGKLIDDTCISNTSKKLIKCADDALYKSKNSGRNKTTIYK